jgi:hypothetical protein
MRKAFLGYVNILLILILLIGCAPVLKNQLEAISPTAPSTTGYNFKILRAPEKIEKISIEELGQGQEVYTYDTKGQLIGPYQASSTGDPKWGKITLFMPLETKTFDFARAPNMYRMVPPIIEVFKSDKMKENLLEFVKNVQNILDDVAKLLGTYEVNQFEVAVTVSAEGGILIVKAKGEGEFRIIFSKKKKK